jgi:predicted transcriptional regulator
VDRHGSLTNSGVNQQTISKQSAKIGNQQRFVAEYLTYFNATRSAIAIGYIEKGADVAAPTRLSATLPIRRFPGWDNPETAQKSG